MIVILKAHTKYGKGGIGSGNHGHSGRPDVVGGSASNGSSFENFSVRIKEASISEMVGLFSKIENLTRSGVLEKKQEFRLLLDIKKRCTETFSVESENIFNDNNTDIAEKTRLIEQLNKDATSLILYGANPQINKNNERLRAFGDNDSIVVNEQYGGVSGYVVLDGYTQYSYDDAREALNEATNGDYSYEKSRAIETYQDNNYKRINAYLRGEFGLQDETELLPQEEALKRQIETMILSVDEGIEEESDTLKHPTVLNRWVGEGHPIYDAIAEAGSMEDAKIVKGSIYTEKCFCSTTVNRHYQHSADAIKIQIRAKAGTKGLAFNDEIYDLEYPEEYEFLLPRNTSFRVVGKDVYAGTVIVEIVE